jgi:hypothetical protein
MQKDLENFKKSFDALEFELLKQDKQKNIIIED